MNHELLLLLEMLEQAPWGFRFKLIAQNCSTTRLLLPSPRITGIRFLNAATMKEAEWYTCLLVSADLNEFTLEPGESRLFEWRVRPSDVEGPADDRENFDYYRWCAEVPPGAYTVWYQWRVDDTYFDPGSHMRLADMKQVAQRKAATVWLGKAVSNRVDLMRN